MPAISGLTWIALAAVLVIAGVVALVLWRRARRRGELHSIVMLRGTPRRLSEADVRGAARRAISPDVDAKQMPSPDPGTTSAFVVVLNGAPGFFVIDAGRPYTDDPQGESHKFEDPGARAAYAAHGAWLAVDLVGGAPPKDLREQVARLHGRLSAELLDQGCTLLYAPALSRFALPGPEVERTLRGPDPYSIFSNEEVNTPMFHAEAGDNAIEEAMERARREWPALVDAWNRAGKESHALAKGRFTTSGGGNEYIWLEVSGAAEDGVIGTVANRPADVPGLSQGQSVTVPLCDIADWAFTENGRPRGMFVERIIRRKMSAK